MTEETLCEELTDILRKLKKIEPDDDVYSWSIDLFDYGYLDSFGVVELLMEISNNYKIDMSNEDFYQELRSVKAISIAILDRLKR